MSRFYLNDDSASSTSSLSDELSSLPYPAALPRTDFLTPHFDPSSYLSSLGQRHQTLEDLRSDLRSRSQLLTKELLDLVNAHYADFLSLGTSLKGGEEKVEELKLGLLGFRREVEEVRRVVAEREEVVDGLLEERKMVRRDIALGKRLVEWDGRLRRLEGKLMVDSTGEVVAGEDVSDSSAEEEDEEEDDVDEGAGGVSAWKLRRRVQDFLLLRHGEESIGAEHPLVVAQRARVMRVRNTLLLDLGTALRQARSGRSHARSMKIMEMYRNLGAAKDAVDVLGNSKR